jgi:hypothetical protein
LVAGCSAHTLGSALRFSGLASIKVPAVYDGASCSLIARQIAWSLDNEPDRWSTDGYKVTRDGSGASVWVANEAYGMSIAPDPQSVNGSSWNDECGKELVYRSYQHWLERATGQTP